MTMTQTPDTTYNGWANYETWNVALWIQNDEPLYRLTRVNSRHGYEGLVPVLQDYMGNRTPDGVAWDDPELDIEELNEMMEDL